MTFTPNPPTKPGFYAWKKDHEGPVTLIEVYQIGDGSLSYDFADRLQFNCNVDRKHGLWCELLPSSEVVTKEQHEKDVGEAFREGHTAVFHCLVSNGDLETAWLTSTARKRLEGK